MIFNFNIIGQIFLFLGAFIVGFIVGMEFTKRNLHKLSEKKDFPESNLREEQKGQWHLDLVRKTELGFVIDNYDIKDLQYNGRTLFERKK